MKVSVFCDVSSVWCYIATTRLERAAAAYTLRTGEPVEIRLRACRLEPDEGESVPWRAALVREHGSAAEQAVAGLRAAARTAGIDLDLDNGVRASSFDAHRLLLWAEVTAGLGEARDLAHELWKAAFSEGADIADHDTLAARAGAVGLDIDAAEAWLASDGGADEIGLQRSTAVDIGITEVPTIVVDDSFSVEGVQTQVDYAQVLNKVARER